jgi:hypothetical protein
MHLTQRLITSAFAVFCSFYSTTGSAGDLEGIVKDPAGKPLANAIVAATPLNSTQLGDERYVIQTTQQGRFHLTGLPGGSYAATATFPNLGPAFLGNLIVPAVGTLREQNLYLSSEATTVSGSIDISSGTLPEQLYVIADKISDEVGNVSYGRFYGKEYQISLAAGEYMLILKGSGWTSIPKRVVVPGKVTQLNFVLHPASGSEPSIAAELEAMKEADQDVRNRLMHSQMNPTIAREMDEIDAKNEVSIRRIIQSKGWPNAKMVGLRATNAAWLLVQHASPALLKECIPYMHAAAERAELPWPDVALSVDRDLIYSGKKQIYGTQFHAGDNGKMVMDPVEDEARLDDRREKIGLAPIAEYKAQLLQMYEAAPANE